LLIHLIYLAPKPNPILEQMINDNKNKAELDWTQRRLTDDHMATIAYYLLKDNKVSNLLD
jgi:hypothetical protein